MDMEQPSIQIRKRGRPKKTEDNENKPEQPKNDRKEYLRQRYIQQKDKFKECAAESQKRYRDAYKILIKIYNNNVSLPDELKNEIIKIISV
jgi:hypothetical protein